MGSGGTEFDTADEFNHTRLNQKTKFVGTGEQATNLITSPQIGQQVLTTDSSGVFTANKISIRNTADSAWNNSLITETSAQTLGGLGTDFVDFDFNGDDTRWYDFVTLPTTYKYYILSTLSIVVGTNNSTMEVQMGVDLVNANPPTNDNTTLVGLCRKYDVADLVGGAPTITLPIAGRIMRGGAVLGLWVNRKESGAGDALLYGDTPSGTIYSKAETFTSSPAMANNTAFTSQAAAHFKPLDKMRLTYYGYS